MGNWHTKKYLDSQTKGKIGSQNILGLAKQILMELQMFFLFHALCKTQSSEINFDCSTCSSKVILSVRKLYMYQGYFNHS